MRRTEAITPSGSGAPAAGWHDETGVHAAYQAHGAELYRWTVRSRVFYGLKALRVAMDEMGVTP